MKPTIKITYDNNKKQNNIFYISYEKIIELINEKEEIDIIDIEVFG